MDLLRNIRNDRARQRRKQPRGGWVFSTVSTIVREYGLDENFLKMLDNPKVYPTRRGIEPYAVKTKKVLEFPPFSLVSKEQYGLAVIIMDKLSNPYLQFAHSPEEILLSALLYEADPSLKSEDLLRFDFETLLLCRHADDELANLKKQLENIKGTADRDNNMEEFRGERQHLNRLRERIQQLEAFVSQVESMRFQPR